MRDPGGSIRGGRGGSGEERLGEPDDERAARRRRLAGSAAPQTPSGTGAASRRGSGPSDHPSEVEPLLQRAGQRAAEVERQAAQDIERFASQQMAEAEATEGFASAAEVAAAGAETAAAVETGGALTALGEGALAAGAATGGLVAAGAAAAVVGTASRSREESPRPRTCWAGAPRRAAARTATPRGPPEPRTCQDFFSGSSRGSSGSTRTPRASRRPSLGNRFRARPIRRQGQGRQQPTPFGINQVPIPVSSGSERSRISRQYRGDRGPLATPSFDALRTASEPEAA